MNREKIAYFLNATFYFFYLGELKFYTTAQHFAELFWRFLGKLFLSRKRQEMQIERIKKSWVETYSYFYDIENGMVIRGARGTFEAIYGVFSVFISLQFCAIVIHMTDGNASAFALLPICLILGYFCDKPIRRYVFKNNCYLKYFKEFEKEDEAWRKKWRRITWLSVIAAALIFVLGMASMFGIWILLNTHIA